MPDKGDKAGAASATFLNPVYPHSFPDPFVLKFGGEYFAYATGFANDGRAFPVLRSSDLVNWQEVGSALDPLPGSPPFYWAPEVVYDNGKFYLYYSVGNEVLMEIRVAVSGRPDGGFVDAGVRLTKEDFAIDAHVFVDDDGTKYLFYATDFLTHSHIGTGTVMDEMIDWFTLKGDPNPVTRAKYDWQVYDPNRKEKGGVRWHTVEGPAVIKRKNKYYEMFSGGNWQNVSYGVSFAISDSLESDDEWRQFSDGVNTMPILRTIPDAVIGPGHNCIVRGPNNRELYCVYHRWTDAGRVMAIDRLEFAGDKMFVVGATHTPQPVPFPPTVRDRSADPAKATRERSLDSLPGSFLLELTWGLTEEHADSRFEVEFETSDDTLTLAVDSSEIALGSRASGKKTSVPIPSGFAWKVSHLLRVEADQRRLCIKLDAVTFPSTTIDSQVVALKISDNHNSLLIKSLDLTEGFEELFEDGLSLDEKGWITNKKDRCTVENGELFIDSTERLAVRKAADVGDVELAANFRVPTDEKLEGEFGLVLFDGNNESITLSIDCGSSTVSATMGSTQSHPLPGNILLSQYHQLRIVKLEGRALFYFDDVLIAESPGGAQQTHAAVFSEGVPVAIDMIRITSI